MIHSTLDNKKIILFGHGTIKITSAYIDEKGMLALQTNDERTIGMSEETTKTHAERINEVVLSEILMEFDNIKSLEVLILKLQEVRAMMLGMSTDEIDAWKKIYNLAGVYEANSKIDGLRFRHCPKEQINEK